MHNPAFVTGCWPPPARNSLKVQHHAGRGFGRHPGRDEANTGRSTGDDDGFTAQFMARLPAPKTLNPWLEKAIIAVPVLLISLLVLSHFPWRELVQPVYGWFLLQDLTSLLSMGVAVFIALVVAPVAWLFSGES